MNLTKLEAILQKCVEEFIKMLVALSDPQKLLQEFILRLHHNSKVI
jgi:hypothetical protein